MNHLEETREKMDEAASDSDLSREDYREYLEEVRSEASIRLMALEEEGD